MQNLKIKKLKGLGKPANKTVFSWRLKVLTESTR